MGTFQGQQEKTSVKIYCKSSVLTLFIKGTMKESEKVKIKNKQKIFEVLDFTGFTSTFEEKICFSLNGIERNYKLTTFYISL